MSLLGVLVCDSVRLCFTITSSSVINWPWICDCNIPGRMSLQYYPCADGGPGPTPKTHKFIGYLSNTGPDPLENNKAIKPVFNVGPPSSRRETP